MRPPSSSGRSRRCTHHFWNQAGVARPPCCRDAQGVGLFQAIAGRPWNRRGAGGKLGGQERLAGSRAASPTGAGLGHRKQLPSSVTKPGQAA
jgi:hypothetical protein